MISSKRINAVTIALTAAVLLLTVIAMLLPHKNINGKDARQLSYGENHTVNIDESDYYTNCIGNGIAKINLKGDIATSGSKNVKIDGGDITVLGGGVYVLSGKLSDGTVTVNSTKGGEVRLVLNGADITSSDFSAIYVKQSEKTIISLVEGTENIISDSADYNEENLDGEKPDAAIYSKDDLTINGKGSLTVNGNYRDGIKVNDILRITEGHITVNAADDAVNANDCIVMLDAEITVTSGGDGIKCENEDNEKGFAAFEKTNLNITSGGDSVSASSGLYINDANVNTISGGGSENAPKKGGWKGFGNDNNNTVSSKALKSGKDIVINGGSFTLDSRDDSLHSDNDMTVEGGSFIISSGDDGIHTEKKLVLNPEKMEILKCYEGIEGAYITINGGNISIVSDDDGINAAGENASNGFGMMRGRQGISERLSEEDIWLTVNGGNIRIETSGDGFDSNGSAAMNGGCLEIYGPENGGNGSIDVGDGGYVMLMNKGTLIAAGSSSMAEEPSESSKQNSIAFYLDQVYNAGSTFEVIGSNGEQIVSKTSGKSFAWVCVSSEKLKEGESYTLYVDGEDAGSVTVNGTVSVSGTKNDKFGMRGYRGKN